MKALELELVVILIEVPGPIPAEEMRRGELGLVSMQAPTLAPVPMLALDPEPVLIQLSITPGPI